MLDDHLSDFTRAESADRIRIHLPRTCDPGSAVRGCGDAIAATNPDRHIPALSTQGGSALVNGRRRDSRGSGQELSRAECALQRVGWPKIWRD